MYEKKKKNHFVTINKVYKIPHNLEFVIIPYLVKFHFK